MKSIFSKELQRNYEHIYLHGSLPGKLVSKRGDILWPPKSPDIVVLFLIFVSGAT